MLKMQLITAVDRDFAALYEIYCESISLREQKAKVDLAAMVSKPNYRLLLAHGDSTVVGFSIVYVARGESFCLLEYMAVDKSYRGPQPACPRPVEPRQDHARNNYALPE
jgi:hypothetical protein